MKWKRCVPGDFAAALILFTASSSFSRFLETITMFAPLLENMRAALRPVPSDPPVRRIVRPSTGIWLWPNQPIFLKRQRAGHRLNVNAKKF
ncbi:uncharacterized protein F4822DRAFT_423333 [Hypoxylon trugodes]|uniref:uncharacterized protein n=1 Tax=Hypoxylon trugodes TaxID=326681 RepID=UPI00219C76CA|nr:uncharacterized protein F4822DRAFT_423333 [Hypoxylon trugodes]KAI1382723.1 hypothetical protein F4822DRAFT_423333 [Hypoxylon trugodes]